MEFGGALGLILYAAQAISVAFYCVGFGEDVSSLMAGTEQTVQLAAASAAVVLFGLAYVGADLATKFQFVIMAILAAALASFFAGARHGWDTAVLEQAWSTSGDTLPFWIVFAIFFPAVTGFTQGVSMSGDLKDTARSLPYLLAPSWPWDYRRWFTSARCWRLPRRCHLERCGTTTMR